MMKKSLIKYILLPKGFTSILFKSYVYFVPFLYILSFSDNITNSVLIFLELFILFEFVIGPSRYQFNDYVDYESDQKRKFNWNRPVNKQNKNLILLACLSRFVVGSKIAFLIDFRLGILAVLLFLVQVFYDLFAKKYSTTLSVLLVSAAYPLRSMVIFWGFDFGLNLSAYLILFLVFSYATYTVLQWRKNESLFIISNDLDHKPRTRSFVSKKIEWTMLIILGVFLLTMSVLIAVLLKIGSFNMWILVGVSLVFILLFSTLKSGILSWIARQSHNIIILLIFICILGNPMSVVVSISTAVIFITFWYHKVYIKEFATKYFNQKHYEKED